MSRIIEQPEHWRRRAEEARAIARRFEDPDVRQMMLSVALAYDELAERAAERRELREVLIEQPAKAPDPED